MANRNFNSKNIKSEFNQKMIDIRRTARVMAGGRRFSFRVALVAGDGKGSVGLGVGKGVDVGLASEKALRNAKKNLVKIELTKNFSISHETSAKFASARVVIRPAKKGKGIIAGSAVRTVLDLAGIKNAGAKILSRSKNKINIARATTSALAKLK